MMQSMRVMILSRSPTKSNSGMLFFRKTDASPVPIGIARNIIVNSETDKQYIIIGLQAHGRGETSHDLVQSVIGRACRAAVMCIQPVGFPAVHSIALIGRIGIRKLNDVDHRYKVAGNTSRPSIATAAKAQYII